MAFGFSPKHVRDLPLGHITPYQFLILAHEAAKKLRWDVSYVSETGFIAFTEFSMSSWSEQVTVRIGDTSVTIKSECNGNQLMDWGKNKENVEELTREVALQRQVLTDEIISSKYEELKSTFVEADGDPLASPPTTAKEKMTGVLGVFKPVEGYFITPLLIDLNLIVFILMVIAGANVLLPDNQTLLTWGANFRPITLQGQWWRLFTSFFLHIGIFHLLMNMYALLYIGLLLEPYLGKARFAAAYLFTGIASSVTSLWWHDLTISAGASGAIFGMYGVFLAMLSTNLIEKAARKAFLTSILIFVGYNLINGLKGGIDNAAHIGGLISGVLIGFTFYFSLYRREEPFLKYQAIAVAGIGLLAVSFFAYTNISNDIAEYDKGMNDFASQEEMALTIYSMPKDTPKDVLLSEIKDRGLFYWNENVKLIKKLDKLDIPERVHDQNRRLLEYCSLRIRCYHLLYKTLDADTDQFSDSLEYYNKEIEAAINRIKEVRK